MNTFLNSIVSPFIKGGDCGITGKNDGEDYRRLIAAMDILHFSPEDQSSIFRVLASILHLGNIFFQRHQVNLHSFYCHICFVFCIFMQSLLCCCITGRWPGGGDSDQCSGDQSGGRAPAALTRGATESHHIQSHGQNTITLGKLSNSYSTPYPLWVTGGLTPGA